MIAFNRFKPIIKSFLLSLIALSFIAVDSFSQVEEPLELVKTSAIQFDGVVDHEEWNHIQPLPLVQYSPDAGLPPTERTEIRFAYDDHFLYASMRAFDRSPDLIRGNSLYRDRLAGSDHFEILLDSYNDNETALIFNTISTGVRTDGAIANDATGGTISSSAWFNGSFNTFWDTKVTKDSAGWYVETRIPFSSLRFQNIDGNVIMGLSVQRKIARKLERLVFPNIPPENDWAFLKPSLAHKILLKDIEPSRTVYVTPYVLAGIERAPVLDNSTNEYSIPSDERLDLGGDIKFSITNNLTADFTVNTDFAQVEADDQLINLSRFSLFFPEKRQFFQERSSVFEFRTGGRSRVFFSRRIGLDDSGNPVPILGGARLVGRLNDWDIGVLNMQTQSSGDIDPENFGVFRIKRRIFNQNSTIGGIFTSRLSGEGRQNFVYGVDGLFRILGDEYLTVNWSQSFDQQGPDAPRSINDNNGRLTIELNRRRRSGFGYNLGTIYSGENYRPKVGFVERENFKFFTTGLSHTKIFPEGSSFILQSFGIEGSLYIDNTTERTVSAEIIPSWSFQTRSLDNGDLRFIWAYENLLSPLRISGGITIPTGEYKFSRITASYNMAGEKIIRTRLRLQSGTFYDGWLHSFTVAPSWFVSKHLELGLEYSFNRLDFDDRQIQMNLHIARLRIGTAVNSRFSANALVQYGNNADLFSANVRLRYNFREGNDFWFVINEAVNTEIGERAPILPRSNGGSILVKYVHTFLF